MRRVHQQFDATWHPRRRQRLNHAVGLSVWHQRVAGALKDQQRRVAAMELGGWDTHTAQASRIAGPLKALDDGMVALKTALGPAWKRTVVLTMTEFGRTVRMNGTGGTDHGTASVAFLMGGSVKGGRVVANWPGLGPGKLLEDRDLLPTADLRGLAKGALGDHLGLRQTALEKIFPGSSGVESMKNLLA